jgi:hypothetical protein
MTYSRHTRQRTSKRAICEFKKTNRVSVRFSFLVMTDKIARRRTITGTNGSTQFAVAYYVYFIAIASMKWKNYSSILPLFYSLKAGI